MSNYANSNHTSRKANTTDGGAVSNRSVGESSGKQQQESILMIDNENNIKRNHNIKTHKSKSNKSADHLNVNDLKSNLENQVRSYILNLDCNIKHRLGGHS